ncbi:MAG: MFS transporter [Anaerolineales bacterium]|nr:MFS transporter [Anaerolineales bacterium]
MQALSPSDVVNRDQRSDAPRLWIAKLYYFLFFGAIGALAPFFNIYLQQRGLSGAEIGFMSSIPPVVTLVAGPIWAGIADRSRRHQLVLALCVFMSGVVSIPYLWTTGFWPLFLLVVVMAFFRTPVAPLLDAIVLGMVKGTGSSYGAQRLFGSIGYILATYGVGLVLTANNLGAMFVLHAVLLIAGCTALSFFLPAESVTETVDMVAGLRKLTRQPGYTSFLVTNVLQGMATAAFFGFLGLRLLDIGATEQQVGLAFALAASAEVPVMALGGRMQARFRLAQMIIFGLIGVGVAYFLIGLANTPVIALAVMPFIGVFYSAYWMGVVAYANEAAPPGLRATGQSLMSAAQFGLGWALGSIIAGIIWGAFGGGWVFIVGAVLMFAAMTVFAVGTRKRNALLA